MKNRLFLACLLLSCSAQSLQAAPSPVPSEFTGDWVPQKQPCHSTLRLRVASVFVSLINGKDVQRFANPELCHTCAGGARYQGNEVWLAPGPGDDEATPFTVRFNANEEKRITVVEIEDYALKKRFPLHNVKLRKCAP